MEMERTPVVTTLEEIQKHSAYQALEPVRRPPYWGADLDRSRRPGVPMMRPEPRPLSNAQFPIERQRGEPASPRHGRPNKPMPPVFGTACPLHGVSGAIRRFAYQYPDHYPRHWLLKMLGDRVESWGHRAWQFLPLAGPFAAATFAVRFLRAAGASWPMSRGRGLPHPVG